MPDYKSLYHLLFSATTDVLEDQSKLGENFKKIKISS